MYWLKLGFTDDRSLLTSKTIRKVTGGPSHVLVEVFEVTDGGRHDHYYFESMATVDKTTHKNGVRGPLPASKLAAWLAEKPASRTLVEVPGNGYLPLTQEEAAAAVSHMKDATRLIHYAGLQLVGNFVAATLKTRLTFGSGSPLKWTCCEMPVRTRVLPPRWWDLLGLDNVNADELWPGGSSQFSLMAGVFRVIEKHGALFV